MSGAREILFHFAFLILPTEDIKLNSLTAVTSNANRSVFKLVIQIFDTTMCSKIRKLYSYRTTCSLINGVWPSSRALDSGAGGRGFDPHSGRRVVSLSKIRLSPPKSTGKRWLVPT